MTTAFICDKCGGIIGGAVDSRLEAGYDSPKSSFRFECDLCDKCAPKVLDLFSGEFKNLDVEEK